MPRFLRHFCWAFGGIGLLMLAGSVYLFVQDARFAATAVRAQGVVIGDNGTPVVSFVADRQTVRVRGRVSSKPPSHHAGDPITVLYQEDEPEKAHLDTFAERWLGSLILGGMGLVFGGIGGGFVLAARRGQRRRERALSFGRPVQAKVTSVYFDTTLRVNGRSPWVIAATFDDSSGRKLEFKSERLWYDPTPYYPNGSEVTVYFLDDDPRVNAFQLDKLPEGYNA